MCKEVGCQRRAVARTMCLMHYKRARRRGEFKVVNTYGAGLDFLRAIPDTNECVEFPFGRFTTGYGHVKLNGRGRTAHSVAYELHIGPIPDGTEICHNCGNRPCVNPRHLRADTHVANMADKIAHGTHQRGARNPRAILSPEQVVAIRIALSRGRRQIDIAGDFGVSPKTVSAIARGKAWRAA